MSLQITSTLTTIPHAKQQQTILYTNCCSLHQWKVAELQSYIQLHTPQIVCLTETWLGANKQQLININGFDKHYSHCKGSLGGGVCILTSYKFNCILISSYTSQTMSAAWDCFQSHKLIYYQLYIPPSQCLPKVNARLHQNDLSQNKWCSP